MFCCNSGCGAVVNPANGTVATNATIPGSVATYACNPGFIIYGVNTRTCVVNTGWSGYQPTCVAGDFLFANILDFYNPMSLVFTLVATG